MAQQFSDTAKATMLDALTCDLLSLHDDDPGSDGTANELSGGGYARESADFDPASAGARALATDVTFTGTANAPVSWVGFWKAAGAVFISRAPLTGDATLNSVGEYIVKATTTKLQLTDPA